MERYLDTLSWFNMQWPKYPKDEIYNATIGKRIGYAIAFETDRLQILISIMKGSRGGITGLLIITDPSQMVEVDRLICCDCSISGGSWINETVDVEVHISKEDFDTIVPKLIFETMQSWKDSPELARARATIVSFGRTSVVALSGGSVSPR
jgi:hypothetical protein